MKIKIENLLKTSRIFGNVKHQDIVNKALEAGIINNSDVTALSIENHCIFASRRLSDNIITRCDNIKNKLDKFSPDFSNISIRIQNYLAKIYNIANANDVGLTTINKIEKNGINLQFYIDKKTGWQDLEVEF